MPGHRDHENESSGAKSEVDNKPNPMSLAIEWVARITAVALVMVVPGVAGGWLDGKLGTEYLALVGFGVGFCVGFVALLAMVNPKKASG